MKKKTLVMLGHPSNKSFCGAIADTYEKAANDSGKEVKRIDLSELEFKDFVSKEDKLQLEPGLKKAQELISWADHIVFVYPTWWSSMPARFKAFFERTFEPEFAFRYHKKDPMWDKLLSGKSAHVFVTMDAPYIFYKLFFGASGHKMFKKGILEFCGIKPVKFTNFGPMVSSTDEQRKKWLEKVEKIAKS